MQVIRRLCSKKMSKKIVYPAAERNKASILQVLRKHFELDTPGMVLEISSGTGQQVSYFARHFPRLEFQPSEYDASLFESIRAYVEDTPTKNVKDPISINAADEWTKWNLSAGTFDYVININMIHVTAFPCTIGLFKNSSAALRPGGLLVTYGAYANKGVLEPQSNRDFDRQIREKDPSCGVRDIQDLIKVAEPYGMVLRKIYDMPANNKCLIWEKVRQAQ